MAVPQCLFMIMMILKPINKNIGMVKHLPENNSKDYLYNIQYGIMIHYTI